MRGEHSRPRAGRTSRRGLLAVLAAAVVAAVAAVAVAAVLVTGRGGEGAGQVAGEETPRPAFGVLGSRCDPERMSALAEAGVRWAEVGLSWASFEPVPGAYDEGYAALVRAKLDSCEDAGIDVVLTLGLHSAPHWVAELPGGSYVNQHGDRGERDVPNLVFNAGVREAVAGYLAELDRAVGLERAGAIRVGTGVHGELGYPGGESSDYNPLWAFDAAAQEGVGLAEGAQTSPMPGWTPGSPTWEGAEVGTEQVREWYRWYSRSVADAVVWVVHTLRDVGYTGDIHLPLAGRGALPTDLEAALAAGLDGTADRDGSFEQGLFYPEQLPHIAGRLAATEQPGWGAIHADSSSVDDATAVTARQLDPPQDSCRPGDADLDLLTEAGVENWSSVRWTVANARRAGLEVMGENPGSPDTPRTGGNELTDSSAEQMVHAPRYARECDLAILMWAFEDDLFGTGEVTVADYAEQIQGPTAGTGEAGG